MGQWPDESIAQSLIRLGFHLRRRKHIARHFVQRTRKDIETHWEGEHCFPVRETPPDETYGLSDPYRQLFYRTYDFCSEIVRTGEGLGGWKRRVRYWGRWRSCAV